MKTLICEDELNPELQTAIKEHEEFNTLIKTKAASGVKISTKEGYVDFATRFEMERKIQSLRAVSRKRAEHEKKRHSLRSEHILEGVRA